MEFIKYRNSYFFVVTWLAFLLFIGCGRTEGREQNSNRREMKNEKTLPESIRNEKNGTSVAKQETDSFQKIPVYGKEQKKEIKKYLATLPDKHIEINKAESLNIIMVCSLKKEQKIFDRKWQLFYEEIQKLTCATEEKRAIVFLNTTVEGDSIYTYLSYISGEWFLYVDNSRDAFRGEGQPYFSASFQGLVDREVKNDEGRGIAYYLLKDAALSEKKLQKRINSPEFVSDKNIYLLYKIRKTGK